LGNGRNLSNSVNVAAPTSADGNAPQSPRRRPRRSPVANTDDFNRKFQELFTEYRSVYCGYPAAVDAHRAAKQVLADEAKK
jgi:hypothetical protein